MSIGNQAGYQAYQKNKYATASPHKLTLLLYEAALANIDKASKAIDERQVMTAHKHILKTQDIISELMISLNEEQGGELATNLKRLYLYVIDCLVQGNLRKKREPLQLARDVIEPLKTSWEQIGKEVSIGK